MVLTLLYFAWVREQVGTGEEKVDPPATLATVADLVAWLAARGGGYASAFADPARLRAAVDQRAGGLDLSITGAREVAIFPPVTGG